MVALKCPRSSFNCLASVFLGILVVFMFVCIHQSTHRRGGEDPKIWPLVSIVVMVCVCVWCGVVWCVCVCVISLVHVLKGNVSKGRGKWRPKQFPSTPLPLFYYYLCDSSNITSPPLLLPPLSRVCVRVHSSLYLTNGWRGTFVWDPSAVCVTEPVAVCADCKTSVASGASGRYVLCMSLVGERKKSDIMDV